MFFNHSVNSPVNPGRQTASPVLWGRSDDRCSRHLRRYAAMLATCFVLTVVGVPGQLSAQTVEDTETRPNILVFVSDDMGWGQPGFNGGTEVETPHMDRLADEGVKLTQFYVQPVCAPTRASLLTGRYAWKTGAADNPDSRMDDGLLLDERTIAEALRDSSYATWLVGKWHAGHWGSERLPLQRGFDHHYGFYNGFIDSYKHVRPWRYWHEIMDWHRNGRPVVESGYSTFLLAEEASQLIERHDGSRPFFLYVAFNAPHDPYQAPPEYIAQFSHLPYDLETRKQRAMVKAMDDAIGQVMDALERRGVLDETLVMFLNDNGGLSEAGGNSPYRGLKGSYLEGGIRVPAVMRWPSRITAGSASDALMHVADLFPTFAGLAGADTGRSLPLDGLDVWEAIANGAESPREEVVHSLDVIRVGDWKLLEEDGEFAKGDKSSPLQLYNIAEDPYETTNLASSETEKVAELRARLNEHRPFARDAEPGAPIPGLDSIDSTDDRPVMFGEEENTAFGAAFKTALTQRQAGNLGPELLRIEASGDQVKLIYDETLDADSVPPADAFTVVVNPGYRAAEVVGVQLSESEVVLTLAEPVAAGNTVGLTYEVPDTGAIQDADSLEAVGITWVTPPPPPPPPPPPGGGGGGGGSPRETVPDVPTNLVVETTDGAVTLTWEAPEDDGGSAVTDYEYRINRRNPWISIGSTATTHTVAGLVNGTAYVFQVRAVNRIGRSGPSLPAEATPIAQVVLDLAHFANGAGIISEVVLVNVAPHPIQPALYFYDQEGEPIAAESMVDVLGDLGIQEDGGLTIRTEMEPLGELTISTHGRGDLVSGSVKVAAYGTIGGVLRFDIAGIGVAGVQVSQPLRDAIFPVRRREGGIDTGMALHNREEEAAVVSCRLMKNGAVLEEVEITLAANGQVARFIGEVFTGTDTSDFVGLVRCTAEGVAQFTGMALELDAGNRIFTTLPVVAGDPSGGGGRETVLDFAHFANGDGITSELVFVNRSTQPSRPAPTHFHSDILPNLPVLYFYDQSGALIDPESVVDVTGDLVVTEDGSLSVQTEMEPLGVLTILTHGRGDLLSGSVKVTSDRPIGGVLRFDLPGIGVAGVGASQPVRDAIFPARRQEEEISTAVAIHNLTESELGVSCQLMKDGAVLEEVEIYLEANGQEARYIEQMFTGTDTSDFVGSVRCTAPGEGIFTGVAVELDAVNRIFTTLPVVPVEAMPRAAVR